MAREYFCTYHSYLAAIEPLNDEERGRLFTALLTYSQTGTAPDLPGNERFVFPTMREQMDRDQKNTRQNVRGTESTERKAVKRTLPNATERPPKQRQRRRQRQRKRKRRI